VLACWEAKMAAATVDKSLFVPNLLKAVDDFISKELTIPQSEHGVTGISWLEAVFRSRAFHETVRPTSPLLAAALTATRTASRGHVITAHGRRSSVESVLDDIQVDTAIASALGGSSRGVTVEDTIVPKECWKFQFRAIRPEGTCHGKPVDLGASHLVLYSADIRLTAFAVYDSDQHAWKVRTWPPLPGLAAERQDAIQLLEWYRSCCELVVKEGYSGDAVQHINRQAAVDHIAYNEFSRQVRL
jgi:hypothetical protein